MQQYCYQGRAVVAEWLRRCAARAKPKGEGSITTALAAFQMEAKKRKRTCVDFSAYVKYPRVVKINHEPSATARLIAQVYLRRAKHHNLI